MLMVSCVRALVTEAFRHLADVIFGCSGFLAVLTFSYKGKPLKKSNSAVMLTMYGPGVTKMHV